MHFKTLIALLAMLAIVLPQAHAQAPQPPGAQPVPTGPNPPAQALPPALSPIVINVLGEVNRPSRIVLPKGSGLLDAIAAADGFTRVANPADTLLIHKTPGEKPESVKINVKRIMSGTAKDIALRDGDTVVVGAGLF
jgi:protein involved in polysaccharide export with SLBB domain